MQLLGAVHTECIFPLFLYINTVDGRIQRMSSQCSKNTELMLESYPSTFGLEPIEPIYESQSMTLSPLHLLLVCGERIHLIGSMSLSSPPVAGVWWAHTLDWLYDSLSSPPVAGVWWVRTLDWLCLSLLSTCNWCVVSAYTWLSLWLSLLSTCSWCVVSAYTWLALCLSPLHL